MDLWEYGAMKKTTLELPDALMHQVKLRAVRRHQKLKDVIAQLLELGMAASPESGRSLRAPKPVRLKGGARLNMQDIEAAIADGRD
jgi:hypothetical protein